MYLYTKPISMPRGSHYGSDYWICYSFKLQRIVHLYSMLEYENFINLEMDSKVKYFCEQPLEIEAFDEKLKRNKKSVLDFWVYYKDGFAEFQEVKYSMELIGDSKAAIRSQQQIKFQHNWCDVNKQKYRVITEKDLNAGPYRISNLELLRSCILEDGIICKQMPKALYRLLRNKPFTIGELINFNILPENIELNIFAQQFYLGNIYLDINNRPIDYCTEVCLCEEKNTI